MNLETKEKLMRIAMEEATKAFEEGNSPFGAVLTDVDGNIIAISHNTTNTSIDPTAHAEINLIRQITKQLTSKDLSAYYLISNAQSCAMCFAAAIKAKISHFIYGYGEDETLTPQINVFEMNKYCKQKANIETGILKEECKTQLEEIRKKMQ
ncbi:MAG: nucleoside deaminase [Candidatus Magasanikbacteria bacterium]